MPDAAIHPYGFCVCGHLLTPEHHCPTDLDSDPCKCGHWRALHSGACTAQVDKRHVSAGGSALYPCSCREFRPKFDHIPRYICVICHQPIEDEAELIKGVYGQGRRHADYAICAENTKGDPYE